MQSLTVGGVTTPSSGTGPFRIGIGTAGAGAYLDRVGAGEAINVMRRGRRVAQFTPIPVGSE